MNKISNWFRLILAYDQPLKTEYMVVDPSAPNQEIRPITLALTPGDETSQEIIVSAYWGEEQSKVFEKKMAEMEEAKHLYSVIEADLQKASELAKEGKKDESKNLIASLVAKYAASTDPIVPAYNPPLTETNASKKVAPLGKVALKLWKSAPNYMGDDLSEYYVGPAKGYDADALDKSNFKIALEMLGGEGNGVLVGSFGGFGGSFEQIFVHKDSADKVAILQDIENKLTGYPVLDDSDYSEMQMQEEQESYESWAKGDALKIIDQELHRQNPDLQDSVTELELSPELEHKLAMVVFESLSYGDGSALEDRHLIEEADREGLLNDFRNVLSGKEVVPEDPAQMKLFESELKKSFIKKAVQKQAHKKLKSPVFEAASKNPLIKKFGKITFQNIFFDTVEEAEEYQEKMKALQPDQESGVPLWDEVNEQVEQPEAEEAEDLELAPPSVSYDQMEKDKAKDTKNLDKRIEKEVKEQIQSTLEVKRATLFTEKDDALVEAMRGVGRTWEEVREYIIKELKYDKDSVVIYLDEIRAKEEGVHEEPEPLSPPKPPEDLVSPETHDKLVEEVKEKSAPKDELKPEPVEEIARADNGEIKKVALNPLQEPPAPLATPPAPPMTSEPIPSETVPVVESTEPAQGDRVYVEGDVNSKEEGFEGTYVSSYDQKGDKVAVIALDNGQNKEVPMHRVVKASFYQTSPETWHKTQHEESGQKDPKCEYCYPKETKKEADVELESKQNIDVIRLFINDGFPKDKMPVWGTSNVKIAKQPNGWALVNYETPILYRSNVDGIVYFNTQKYSQTTTRLQNDIRKELGGKAPVEVDEKGIYEAIRKDVPTETPEGLSASKELAQIKKEAEALLKEAECQRCEKDNCGGLGYGCKCPCHMTPEERNSSLKVEALPEEAPKPEVVPTEFKQHKIAPPHTEKERAIPADPEMAKTITEVQKTQDNIDQIKRLLAEAESKLKKEKIEIEKQMDRPGLEAKLKQEIERLATMVDATESKLVEMGDLMVRLISGEKTLPYRISDKEILEKITKKFPEIAKHVENIKNGAQSLAKTESFRELYLFPKHSFKRLSKLHSTAGVMDTLSSMYESAMNALKGLSELLSVKEEPVAVAPK